MRQIQEQSHRHEIWDLKSHDSNIQAFDLSSSASEIFLFIAAIMFLCLLSAKIRLFPSNTDQVFGNRTK